MSHIVAKFVINTNNKKYIKIKRNQLLVLDALLTDGGYNKKYLDRSKNVRYSEHSGYLGLNESTIDRIIVSAKTNREDKDDNEILLPNNLSDTYEFKYFFHTHPPTPNPGSRANIGILYEFPSISDIFHFIDHYNMGKTIGSIIIAPEGYYIIYPKNFLLKKIKYDLEIEDKIFNSIEKENIIIQEKAILKYGTNFTDEYFYNIIAQNNKYLKMFNLIINKYLNNQLKIIIKHRSKDNLTNKWIIKQLYLPI
jgi:hypothetical protein